MLKGHEKEMSHIRGGIKITGYFFFVTFVWALVWAVISYIFLFKETELIKRSSVSIFIIQAMTLVTWLPGVLICVIYFVRDFGKELEIKQQEIFIRKWGSETRISKSEIKDVIKV